jgi:triosephosphate isomerase
MLIAGNWKSNTTLASATALAAGVAAQASSSRVDVAVCVPSIFITSVKDALGASGVKLGAQNLSATGEGAFTGEISAGMLVSAGCSHVIVGHSERRSYYGETDAVVATKVRKALDGGLVPIACIGETLDERRSGEAENVVSRQVEAILAVVAAEETTSLVLAYEPVWAIGTGETATPQQAQDMHAHIRSLLVAAYGADKAAAVPILYGGSMNAANAMELLAQPDVNGGLIGGASMKPADFATIVRAAEANL